MKKNKLEKEVTMKKLYKAIAVVAIIAVAGVIAYNTLWMSCSNGKEQERIVNNTFPKVYKLSPKLYKINEILRPIDMVVLDDYLIIQNDIMPGEPCFYVYKLDSIGFLYKFACIGHGNEEFIAPAMVQNNENNSLSVFDQAKFKLIKYKIHDNSATVVSECQIEAEDNRPWQEIYYKNDSILLYSTLSNTIQSYNINTQQVVDTCAFHSNLKELMKNDYNQSFDGFHFSYKNNRLTAGFKFRNCIISGTVDERGKIKMQNNTLDIPRQLNKNLYDNRYYYLYTNMTSRFIFAQYVGYMFRKMQPFPLNIGKRKFDMLLEVYDYEMNPLCILDLQHEYLRCKMNEKQMKLYTWDMLEDFDYIMCYDYSILKDS